MDFLLYEEGLFQALAQGNACYPHRCGCPEQLGMVITRIVTIIAFSKFYDAIYGGHETVPCMLPTTGNVTEQGPCSEIHQSEANLSRQGLKAAKIEMDLLPGTWDYSEGTGHSQGLAQHFLRLYVVWMLPPSSPSCPLFSFTCISLIAALHTESLGCFSVD